MFSENFIKFYRRVLKLCQEDQPGTKGTIHQVSRETGISWTSVHRIIHNKLQLKCLKKKQAQDLTDANKIACLVCTKQLLRKYPQRLVQFMWFIDEKLFTVTSPVNLQNNRVYVAVPMRKKQVAANRLLRICSNFSKSVMVSVEVSSLGCTELIFIDPGVKINGAYYCDILLSEHLLPAIKELSGSEFFILQKDSAPPTQRNCASALKRNSRFYFTHSLAPNSPDLNLVDYKIWSILQKYVYQIRICDENHLKQRLVEEWNCFDEGIVDHAINELRDHLRACIQANGILNISFEEQHLTQINFSYFCQMVKFNKKMNFYMLESSNFVCPTLHLFM